MKVFYTILLASSLMLVSSCKDDETPGENPPVTENPGDNQQEQDYISEFAHCRLMGLKGKPKEMIERRIQEEDGETFEVPYKYYFNEKGNIIKYDPFGETEAESRWIPVDARINTYQYDDEDRLVVATFHTVGVDGDDEVYTIEYGDHDLYVPLPFAVGTIDFILQKGVKSVKINGKKILECDGSKVEYSNEQSAGFFKVLVTGTYMYENSDYPTSLSEIKTVGESVNSTDNVKYSFSEKGYLLKEEKQSDMSGEYGKPEGSYYEKTVREYYPDRYLAPKNVTFERQSSIKGMEINLKYSLQYWYNDKNLLTGIVRTDDLEGGTNGAEESYSYSEFDEHENWVDATYWLNTDVDETHITGNFTVKRSFTYWE